MLSVHVDALRMVKLQEKARYADTSIFKHQLSAGGPGNRDEIKKYIYIKSNFYALPLLDSLIASVTTAPSKRAILKGNLSSMHCQKMRYP